MKKNIKTTELPDSLNLSIRPLKILVIENDEDLCGLLSELFTEEGFEHSIFHESVNILDIITEFNPDVVLLDYLLPLINGGELCRQIKKNISTHELPVIIYSAFPKVLLSLGDYGCNLFIAKPFEFDYLIQQIYAFAKDYEQIKCRVTLGHYK